MTKAGLLGLAFLLVSSSAWAVERWFLEIREPGVDESTARRSISVELHDLAIPGDPRNEGDTPEDVSLYFRVERVGGRLTVSLWDRGQFVGTRVISDADESRLMARRVGLAAAELAHDLRTRRGREAQQVEREAREAQIRAAHAERLRRNRALGLITAAGAVGLTRGAWLAGPRLGVEFNSFLPLRFSTRVSWSAGAIDALAPATASDGHVPWSLWELGVGAAWVSELSAQWEASLGAEFSAGAVHVGRGVSVDGIAGQSDTWTCRAAVQLGVARSWGPLLRVGLRLDGGALLRPVPLAVDDEQLRLGGLFVGGALSTSIIPR